jgi:transcriptional regulator with XRE-family HTH domain
LPLVKKYARDIEGISQFGSHLRNIRKIKGISQEELANLADVELSQISRIERGVINTSLSQILYIAKALKVHPKELFDFDYTLDNFD